jgi:hypothetical protein
VIVDWNTRLHSLFNKERRVTIAEIAMAFMEEILLLQRHYTSGDNRLHFIHIVIDHHEVLDDKHHPRGQRYCHPQKIRTILDSDKYSEHTLVSVRQKGEEEEEKAEPSQNAIPGFVDFAAEADANDPLDPVEQDASRVRRYDHCMILDGDSKDGEAKDTPAIPLPMPSPSSDSPEEFHWGRLMESRVERDEVWQRVFRAIDAYDKSVQQQWSSNFKAPVMIRHGPHDVVLINPSVNPPPKSRRRKLHATTANLEPGIHWLPRNFDHRSWFAEADKEIQRLVHDYTLNYPDKLIVVHSIDTDFLLYCTLAMYGSWSRGSFSGKVILANHLAMRSYAYAWWADMTDLLRLVFQHCRVTLLEFTTLTVLGGTDFFGGDTLLPHEKLKNKTAPKGTKRLRNKRVRFWENKEHYDNYMKKRSCAITHPVVTHCVVWPAITSQEFRQSSMRERVQNIVDRALELDAENVKMTSAHIDAILENVVYALAIDSFIEPGQTTPRFFID